MLIGFGLLLRGLTKQDCLFRYRERGVGVSRPARLAGYYCIEPNCSIRIMFSALLIEINRPRFS